MKRGVRNFIIQISSDIDEPHERIQLLRLPCIFYLEKTWWFGRYYFRGFIDSAKGKIEGFPIDLEYIDVILPHVKENIYIIFS